MTMMTRIVGCVAPVLLVLVAPPALAAECFCDIDLYPKLLLGKATPEDKAKCEQRPSRQDAVACMRGLSFKNTQNGDQTLESFRLGVEGLVAASKEPALSKSAVGTLLTSQSYRDAESRAKVRPVMARAGRADLWDSLAKASDGDAAASTKVLYAYCEQYPFVVESVDVESVKLAQLWPPPSGLKPAAARKRFACPYGQTLVMSAALRALDGEVPAEALALLTPAQLRLLRNGVYARHGRTFQAKDLQDFYAQESWYKPDAGYTDDRLTAQDKRNLELIQAAETGAGKAAAQR